MRSPRRAKSLLASMNMSLWRTASRHSAVKSPPFHLVERHLLGAPVIELRRPRARMVRHLRGALQRPAVLEVGGDAHRPKRVVADLGGDLGCPRPPLDQRVG